MKAKPYCVKPLAAAVSRPTCRGDASISPSMVLSANGVASRTSSGSLSVANVDELPEARASPNELMAIRLMEHPDKLRATPLRATARRADRNWRGIRLRGREFG